MRFDVSDPAALMKMLEDDTYEFAAALTDEAIRSMKEEVRNQVYASYTPKVYERTYEFLDAIDAEIGSYENDTSWDVGVQPGLITPGRYGTFTYQRRRKAKHGGMKNSGKIEVVYGVHASNTLHDERQNIARYVLGELRPTRPFGYTKGTSGRRGKKRKFLHSYPGHEARDVVTPVLDYMDEIAEATMLRVFGTSPDNLTKVSVYSE